MRRLSIDPWMVVSLVLAGILAVSLVINARGVNPFPSLSGKNLVVKGAVVKLVSPESIYPLFSCPCCGQPLDKNKICCEAARERINFIDSQVSEGKREKEITLAYVKKYGLNSFIDKNKAEAIREELVKSAPASRPIISLSPQTLDLGNVSQKKGKVSTYFKLRNDGKSDLVIERLDTSCGCTFASIVFREEEGPLFAMAGHGYENPTGWKITIPPGEEAQLKVMYDPDVHKDFRGPATREIYVFSNDPVDFEKKVTLELNQVD